VRRDQVIVRETVYCDIGLLPNDSRPVLFAVLPILLGAVPTKNEGPL
jgi:hypothetical protein